MANKAIDVAKYIINHEKNKNRSITNLRLQKLLYFCQGAMIMNTTDNSLCFDDDIEAWDYGPVVPSVYYEYKVHYFLEIPYQKDFDSSIIANKSIIDSTIDAASRFSNKTLVDISHSQKPWADTYKKEKSGRIPQRLIISFFKELADAKK